MSRHQPMSVTGQLLLSEHRHLDRLFEQLLEDVQCGDWKTCQGTWSRFERCLSDHLDTEEKLVLPTFEREYPDETASLRREHVNIRQHLADLGVGLELHAAREQAVRKFVESLKAHATREEALLYRWAKDLPPELAAAVAKRCGAEPWKDAHETITTPRLT